MSMNKQKGNMYSFVTHTWNPISGRCPHECKYCYMKGFNLPELHLKESEAKTNLKAGNFIFIGSGTDMFCDDIPTEWINAVLLKILRSPDNTYLFQSKNPVRFTEFVFPENVVLGTTLESNKDHNISKAPPIQNRIVPMAELSELGYDTMITIEPICDFDLDEFTLMIQNISPKWVNIGADSKGSKLPEPSKDKILSLIACLEKFTQVKIKTNLHRLIK